MVNKWQGWDLRQVCLLQYQDSELLQPYSSHTHGAKSLPVCELLKSRDLISQTYTGCHALNCVPRPLPNSYVEAINPPT